MADEPTMYEVLRDLVDTRIARVHMSFPGRVQAIGEGRLEGRVDVVPMLRRPVPLESGGFTAERMPVLASIPLAQLVNGPWRLTIPAAVGMFVSVVCSDFDIAPFLANGEPDDPTHFESHALDGAIAIPWSAQPGRTISQEQIELGHADCLAQFGSSSVNIAGDSDAASLASRVKTLETAMISHIHPGPGGATGVSPQLAPPSYTPQEFGSTALKLGR